MNLYFFSITDLNLIKCADIAIDYINNNIHFYRTALCFSYMLKTNNYIFSFDLIIKYVALYLELCELNF